MAKSTSRYSTVDCINILYPHKGLSECCEFSSEQLATPVNILTMLGFYSSCSIAKLLESQWPFRINNAREQ